MPIIGVPTGAFVEYFIATLIWIIPWAIGTALLHAKYRAVVKILQEGREDPTITLHSFNTFFPSVSVLVLIPGVISHILLAQYSVYPGVKDFSWSMSAISLSGLVLVLTDLRLKAETVIRRESWNRQAMLRINWYFLAHFIGPFVLAIIGFHLTKIFLFFIGTTAPTWLGVAWVLTGLVLVGRFPLKKLLGTFVPAPDEIQKQYIKLAEDMKNPPQLFMLKTNGSDFANAIALDAGKKSKIAITDKLLDLLTPEESMSIIAHELAHHRFGHIQLYSNIALAWQIVATAILIALGYGTLGLGMLALLILFAFVIPAVSRQCEKQCDQYAALVTSPDALGSALTKLHQAAYIDITSNKQRETTHPLLKDRLKAIGSSPEPSAPPVIKDHSES